MSVDPETMAVYAERAKDYEAKFTNDRPSRNLQTFMGLLPAEGRVLDFGCGHGGSAKFLAEAGFNVDAWDASPEMLALVAPNARISVREAKFSDLDAFEFYDGVWCNFALLHAPREDMEIHLGSIFKALKPKGIFHLGMKLGSGSERDVLGRLYTYYGIEELGGLLDAAGLEILNTEKGAEAGLAGPVERFVIIRAQKYG